MSAALRLKPWVSLTCEAICELNTFKSITLSFPGRSADWFAELEPPQRGSTGTALTRCVLPPLQRDCKVPSPLCSVHQQRRSSLLPDSAERCFNVMCAPLVCKGTWAAVFMRFKCKGCDSKRLRLHRHTYTPPMFTSSPPPNSLSLPCYVHLFTPLPPPHPSACWYGDTASLN